MKRKARAVPARAFFIFSDALEELAFLLHGEQLRPVKESAG